MQTVVPVSAADATATHNDSSKGEFPHQFAQRCWLWLCLLPASLALFCMLLFVAPHMVRPPDLNNPSAQLLPGFAKNCLPEPLEHVRYILSITATPLLLLAGTWVLGKSRSLWLEEKPILLSGCAIATQLALAGFLVLNVCQDKSGILDTLSLGIMLGIAGGAAYLAITKLYSYVNGANRPTETASRASFCAAGLVSAFYLLWRLLPSIAMHYDQFSLPITMHIWSTMGEFAAILQGKTILVDYFPQYQNLLVYFLAPVFAAIGLNALTFSSVMAVLSAAAMAMIYWLLAACTRSARASVLLFIPLCSICFSPLSVDASGEVCNFSNYFAAMPLRYFAPLLVMVLCARYLQKPTTTRLWTLGLVGALTAINNVDFGIPALAAATITVLGWNKDGLLPQLKSGLNKLLVLSVSFILAATAFVALTYLRSGAWPHIGRALAFQKIFVGLGVLMVPLPPFGLYWVIFSTYIAAIYLATIRLIRGYPRVPQENQLTTGMLLFLGVFGCGTLMYYIGRSLPPVIIVVWPVWAITISLLLHAQLRDFRGSPQLSKRELSVRVVPLALLGAVWILFVGATAKLPSWSVEQQRLTKAPGLVNRSLKQASDFLRDNTTPGETVCIIHPSADMLASSLKLRNVYPFTAPLSLFLHQQAAMTMRLIESKGVQKVFVEDYSIELQRLNMQWLAEVLSTRGFTLTKRIPVESCWGKYENQHAEFQLWTKESKR